MRALKFRVDDVNIQGFVERIGNQHLVTSYSQRGVFGPSLPAEKTPRIGGQEPRGKPKLRHVPTVGTTDAPAGLGMRLTISS